MRWFGRGARGRSMAARRRDVAQVAALLGQGRGAAARADCAAGAAELVARGWVRVWRRRGRVCGLLARDGVMVHALYVCPDAQGRGIGARLMREAQSDAGHLMLWTDARNLDAVRFYQKMGFRETHGCPRFASSDGCDERWFGWSAQRAREERL